MKGWSGILLVATAGVHFVFGIVQYGEPLREIVADGVLNAIGGDPARLTTFWFFFFGFVLALLGQALFWIERRMGRRPPAFLGWQMLGVATLGGVAIPASGFWLVVPQAIYIIVAAKNHQTNQ